MAGWRVTVAAVLAVAFGCSGPGSITFESTPAPGVVKPAEAEAAVRVIWSLEEQLNVSGDVSTADRFLGDPELAVQRGIQAELTGRNAARAQKEPRRITTVELLLSRHSEYPVTFSAIIEYADPQVAPTAQTQRVLQGYAKTDASDRWREILAVPITRLPVFKRDGAGYVVGPSSSRASVVDPAMMADTYLKYVDDARQTGEPPAGALFAPGKFTSDLAKAMHDIPGQVSWPYRIIFQSVGTSTLWATAVDGTQLVMFSLTFTAQNESRSGQLLLQDQARQSWGGLIAPGVHGTIKLTHVIMAAATDPPAGGQARVDVIGAADRVVSGQG